MTSQSLFRRYVTAIKHLASTRGREVLALQASPILGSILGGFSFGRWDMVRGGLLLFGSFALTAHVFVFNDWAGHSADLRDPQRPRHGISRRQIARVAIALLLFANVAFAALGSRTMLFASAIAVLSLLYSGSKSFGKSTPMLASTNHVLGGALHFLLGYTSFHSLDLRGLAISLFFGLVFAGGHLNQVVRDYEGDRLNGIRTSAVVFGCRRTFLASLYTFTAAYAFITVLAAFGILPRLLLWSIFLWPLHLAWSLRALKSGLGFETALWMQHRYRLLFALIGLAMLVR